MKYPSEIWFANKVILGLLLEKIIILFNSRDQRQDFLLHFIVQIDEKLFKRIHNFSISK